MIKHNLQVVKPRARPIRSNNLPDAPTYWRVQGSGITRLHFGLERAYRLWVEEYINRALYPRDR